MYTWLKYYVCHQDKNLVEAQYLTTTLAKHIEISSRTSPPGHYPRCVGASPHPPYHKTFWYGRYVQGQIYQGRYPEEDVLVGDIWLGDVLGGDVPGRFPGGDVREIYMSWWEISGWEMS